MGARLAATVAFVAALSGAPARAQLVPKASPTTPVEASHLSALSDPFPGAEWAVREPPPAVDKARLLVTADAAFSDPPPAELPGTRALLVVHHGAVVYARYAEGFSASSLFPSWSMSDPLVAAGTGILGLTQSEAANDARAIALSVAPGAKDRLARRAAIKGFYAERLFAPLGITSAVLEFDRSGNIAADCFAHMTAEDYARLGYLYLRGGEWNGRQILPAGRGAFRQRLPGDPTAFLTTGDGGQAIVIAPTRGLVIVRLGNTPASAWPAIHAFLRDLVAAFPPA